MNTHTFFLSQGIWQGEGEIVFDQAPDRLYFQTKWYFALLDDQKFSAVQEIHIDSGFEKVQNRYRLKKTHNDTFEISLENDLIGFISGTGVISPESISWEFRNYPQIFEGFEIYRKGDKNQYDFNAEYFSPDQMRTIIKGNLWLCEETAEI